MYVIFVVQDGMQDELIQTKTGGEKKNIDES